MKPMLLWLEHVLGFEQLWEVEFHTTDVDADAQDRLGPQVDRDVGPGVGREVREQRAVRGRSSRARRSTSSTRSCAATACSTSRSRSATSSARCAALRAHGVDVHADAGQLLRHAARAASRRAASSTIDEDLATLRELEILVDGDHHHAYMLQIFLKESAGPLRRSRARARSSTRSSSARATAGFGAGNFRALFESIEREQREARAESSMLDRMQVGDVAAQAPHPAARRRRRRSATRSASRATASTVRTRSSITCAGRTLQRSRPADARLAPPQRAPTRARAREAPLPDRASSRAPRRPADRRARRRCCSTTTSSPASRSRPRTIRSTSPTATPTS